MIISKEDVQTALSQIVYPGFRKSIVAFGFVKDITPGESQISITLDIPSNAPEVEEQLRLEVAQRLRLLGNISVDLAITKPPPAPRDQFSGQKCLAKHTELCHG